MSVKLPAEISKYKLEGAGCLEIKIVTAVALAAMCQPVALSSVRSSVRSVGILQEWQQVTDFRKLVAM